MTKRLFFLVLFVTACLSIVPPILTSAQQVAEPPPPPPRITTENAHQLRQLTRWGRGVFQDIAFLSDGKTLAVSSTIGMWLYDLTDLSAEPRLLGEDLYVLKFAFNQDSSMVALGDDKGHIEVWNVAAGRRVVNLDGHLWKIRNLVFSPDGQLLASISEDLPNVIRLWDITTGQQLHTLRGDREIIYEIVFSLDGQILVAPPRFWNVVTGQEFLIFEEGFGNSIFTPDGQRLITTHNNRIDIWQFPTGVRLATLEGHTAPVSAKALSPDGRLLISGGQDETLRLWDMETQSERMILQEHIDEITEIVFSADGKTVAIADDNKIHLWDVATWTEKYILEGGTGIINRIAFSPDGSSLGVYSIRTNGIDTPIHLWDVNTGAELPTITGTNGFLVDILLSLDNQTLGLVYWDSLSQYVIHLWDATNGQERAILRGHTDHIWDIKFSPDSTLLASSSADNTIRLWDTTIGSEVRVIETNHEEVYTLAFSPDGKTLASSGKDNQVRLWDIATGEELQAMPSSNFWLSDFEFSPDGQQLALRGLEDDFNVYLWDVDTGKEVLTLEGHTDSILNLTFNPDGSQLITSSSDSSIRVWDLTTGDELERLNLDNPLYVPRVFFSNEGIRLVGRRRDYFSVWDIETEEMIFEVIQDGVYPVDISPDGMLIVSGGGDSVVRLWDAATGIELANLEGHTHSMIETKFIANGTRLLTGSQDGTVRLWSIPSQP